MPDDHGIATHIRPPSWRILPAGFIRTAQVRTMFALHRQTQPLATRFVFRIVAVFVLTLTCGLASHAAKAQVRIGIGIGGIGGVLLDDSYRRSQQSEQYQRSHGAAESNSTRVLFQAPFGILIYLEGGKNIPADLVKKLQLKSLPLVSLPNYFQPLYSLKINLKGNDNNLEEYLLTYLPNEI